MLDNFLHKWINCYDDDVELTNIDRKQVLELIFFTDRLWVTFFFFMCGCKLKEKKKKKRKKKEENNPHIS